MTAEDPDYWKRHDVVVEVRRAAKPKTDVVKHLAKTYPNFRYELELLEDLAGGHWHGEVTKEAYLQKLEELTGVDYTPVYDAAYQAHDKQNMKGCFTALMQSVSDRSQRGG